MAERPIRPRRTRDQPVAFEDRTIPGQRGFGVYLIRARDGDYAETYTGPYLTARKLARRRTQYGDIELLFLEPLDTSAID